MKEYYEAHQINWEGKIQAYPYYAEKTDKLHAFCCASAKKSKFKEWCE